MKYLLLSVLVVSLVGVLVISSASASFNPEFSLISDWHRTLVKTDDGVYRFLISGFGPHDSTITLNIPDDNVVYTFKTSINPNCDEEFARMHDTFPSCLSPFFFEGVLNNVNSKPGGHLDRKQGWIEVLYRQDEWGKFNATNSVCAPEYNDSTNSVFCARSSKALVIPTVVHGHPPLGPSDFTYTECLSRAFDASPPSDKQAETIAKAVRDARESCPPQPMKLSEWKERSYFENPSNWKASCIHPYCDSYEFDPPIIYKYEPKSWDFMMPVGVVEGSSEIHMSSEPTIGSMIESMIGEKPKAKSSFMSIDPLYIIIGVVAIGGVVAGAIAVAKRGSKTQKPVKQKPKKEASKEEQKKEERSAFCENCGNPLKPTAKFCGGCGSPRS